MAGNTEQLSTPTQLQITLDGESVVLPGDVALTLTGIRNELEMMALRQERVVSTLVVNGVPVDPFNFGHKVGVLESVQAETTGFGEIGGYVIASARHQLAHLIGEIEEGALLVLINDGPATGHLWQEWERGLRAVLLRLGFFQELQPARMTDLTIDGTDFSQFIDTLPAIVSGVQQMVWDQMDGSSTALSLALSDLIEERLLAWLRKFGTYLEKLYGNGN